MSNETKIIKDAFGCPIVGSPIYSDCSEHIMEQFGVEVDKETGNTQIVKTGELDTFEIVQSYKDQCGMEMALKLIRTGQAGENDFADNGQNSADLSNMPVGLNEAYKASEDSKAAMADIAKKFGIDDYKDGEDLSSKIQTKVNELIQKQTQAVSKKEGE